MPYTVPPDELKTNRSTPCDAQISAVFTAPMTWLATSSATLALAEAGRLCPARYIAALHPEAIDETSVVSANEPTTQSTSSPISAGLWRSIAVTLPPCETIASTTWRPMKPPPPKTRTCWSCKRMFVFLLQRQTCNKLQPGHYHSARGRVGKAATENGRRNTVSCSTAKRRLTTLGQSLIV